MANKKEEKKFGKVQSQIEGFRVRINLKSKKQDGFAVCTTKNLIKDGFKTVKEAELYIVEKLLK